jgi:hypothetical protein
MVVSDLVEIEGRERGPPAGIPIRMLPRNRTFAFAWANADGIAGRVYRFGGDHDWCFVIGNGQRQEVKQATNQPRGRMALFHRPPAMPRAPSLPYRFPHRHSAFPRSHSEIPQSQREGYPIDQYLCRAKGGVSIPEGGHL